MTDVRVVLVTAPTEESAAELAKDLVEARLAACANLVPGVRSLYRWEGTVQDDRETLLIIKTTAARVEALAIRIGERHPYDVPEILTLPVEGGGASYLDWVLAETREPGSH